MGIHRLFRLAAGSTKLTLVIFSMNILYMHIVFVTQRFFPSGSYPQLGIV